MVLLCMGMGFVMPKSLPTNTIDELELVLLISLMASRGYPGSFIIASSLV